MTAGSQRSAGAVHGASVLVMAVLALLAGPAGPAAAEQPLEPLEPQVRLTSIGVDGDPGFLATDPAVAYNSRRNEYFVVWSGNDPNYPDEIDIYGRRLAADGSPAGDVVALSSTTTRVADSQLVARTPAIAYDIIHDQYAVVYTVEDTRLAGSSRIWANLVSAGGEVEGAILVSSTDAGLRQAADPDVVFNSADDRFLVVWSERPAPAEAVSQVFGSLVNAVLHTVEVGPVPYSAEVKRAIQPTVAMRATEAGYAVAWLQNVDSQGNFEVYGRLINRDGTVAQERPVQQITAVEPADQELDAAAPDLIVNPQRRELVLAYVAPDRIEGDEIHVQRLRDTLQPLGSPIRVSDAGRPESRQAYSARQPAITWSPQRARYLVTWQGNDDGRPGLSDAEVELTGQVLDADAREVGTDDFLISRMGLDGSSLSAPGDAPAATVANAGNGEWFVIWSADHAVPPIANDEYELWGRRIGPNFDRDYDGSVVPADCDDLDPARHPGARDIADNEIDEDCSGNDNRDGDGDGVARPRDCNDRDPFIRPGRRDVPGNGIDEDCSGRDTLVPLAAKLRVTWLFGSTTTIRRMLVERVRTGMRVTVRCTGRGCPRGLKGRGRAIRVRRSGRLPLMGLFSGAQLAAGSTVEVRLTHPRAIGLLERYRVRSAAPPAQRTRCLDPARRRPIRCPQ